MRHEPRTESRWGAGARLFVGREYDIARLVALARRPTTRVIVITGPAGVGKTALASRLAVNLREHYPGGHEFVDLQASCGAQPLGLSDQGTYGHRARSARRLLLVDDIAGIDQISSLRSLEGDSLLIATSRHPLPAASRGIHQHTVAALTYQDAMALTAEITRTTRAPDPPDQLSRMATLCTNLPLALWIAAERAAARPLMPLAAITEDLRAESVSWLPLTAGAEHHDEALRTVLTCCYNALPASLARAVRLLASHPRPDFTTAAAQVVLDRPAGQVQATLHTLTAAHWVENHRHDRYHLPTAARSFAAEQAQIEETPDDLRRLRGRVARWYLDTAPAAASSGLEGS